MAGRQCVKYPMRDGIPASLFPFHWLLRRCDSNQSRGRFVDDYCKTDVVKLSDAVSALTTVRALGTIVSETTTGPALVCEAVAAIVVETAQAADGAAAMPAQMRTTTRVSGKACLAFMR